MKKQLIFATAAVMALAFTSCKKYEVSGPLEISELETVKIEGNLMAELDESNSVLEAVPNGTKVMITIPMSEYNPSNTSGSNHVVSTTTKANGKFSLNVPVTNSGIDATLSFASFVYDKKYSELGSASYTEKTEYTLANKFFSGLGTNAGSNSINLGSVVYNENSIDPNSGTFEPTTSVTYEGTLTYLAERRVGVNQPDTLINLPIPSGTEVFVRILAEDYYGQTYREEQTITVGSGGSYSIEVPCVENGTSELFFDSQTILKYEDYITDERFEYNYTLLNIEDLYFTDYANKDFTYSQGALIQQLP
ncbi:hypothetical protein CW751_06870 [Brumimicrobium salinarum]|uniref:Uncharacterized protein n=1 Tax=Brumimicrobium salinarum TaxID=2058658 RepID=A0A2I0R2U2_9FLAO|nr:hypothetical protein [Brumimicrobium salinarum]PKR80886.1 hypothetical protein CW751_06870 [Brumimicrobium salinarum]